MTEDNIKELRAIAARITALLDDPHPGLSTWVTMYQATVEELAAWHGLSLVPIETARGWVNKIEALQKRVAEAEAEVRRLVLLERLLLERTSA